VAAPNAWARDKKSVICLLLLRNYLWNLVINKMLYPHSPQKKNRMQSSLESIFSFG
jgi:hypothetical protein